MTPDQLAEKIERINTVNIVGSIPKIISIVVDGKTFYWDTDILTKAFNMQRNDFEKAIALASKRMASRYL